MAGAGGYRISIVIVSKSHTMADDDVYVVEKIVDHRILPNGQELYLVKWQGYDNPADLTWEPIEHLENLREEIDYFWRHRPAPAPDPPDTQPAGPARTRDIREPAGLAIANDLPRASVLDRLTALAPRPAPPDPDAELEPTPFRDLQRPGHLYVRVPRGGAPAPAPDLLDLSEFRAPPAPPACDFEIVGAFRGDAGAAFVRVRSAAGETEEVDYDAFAGLFPDALCDYLEAHVLAQLEGEWRIADL
jgi:hypothetical protein